MNRTLLFCLTGIITISACQTKHLACCGPCDATGPVVVYKTRVNYVDNISVQLSSDGKTLIAYPGPSDAALQRPVALADSYYLQRMVGNAFTSITFEQYTDTNNHITPAGLLAAVIDTNPFTEYYQCCAITSADTGSLNKIIRNNQLGKCGQ